MKLGNSGSWDNEEGLSFVPRLQGDPLAIHMKIEIR